MPNFFPLQLQQFTWEASGCAEVAAAGTEYVPITEQISDLARANTLLVSNEGPGTAFIGFYLSGSALPIPGGGDWGSAYTLGIFAGEILMLNCPPTPDLQLQVSALATDCVVYVARGWGQ